MALNLARKYRPKILDDLVGQPVITQTLRNAIESDNLRQQYLFVGIYGTGKTSMARMLAAMENCEASPGTNPCGTCNNCRKIFEGTHTDVEEIDAASGAGKVEQVRKLKNSALYNSIDGCKTKYFILDEVQRCSDAALDALLKLLEEPPKHVRFVLCTTEVGKIREAVQSRCQRHDFTKIYWTEIAEHLKLIAKQEKIKIDEEAINLCARLSQGSMRNALYNLEKLVDYVGTSVITSNQAEELFGTASETQYYDLIDYVIGIDKNKSNDKPDSSGGFRIINEMLRNKVEFDVIYQGIADHLRNMLVRLTTSTPYEFINASEAGKRRLKEQCLKVQKDQTIKAIFKSMHALNKAKQSVVYNMSSEVVLQTWFVESVIFFREKI